MPRPQPLNTNRRQGEQVVGRGVNHPWSKHDPDLYAHIEGEAPRRHLPTLKIRDAHQKRNRYANLTPKELEHERRRFRDTYMECDAAGNCFVRGLHITLRYGDGISFCVDCPDTSVGTHIPMWDSHHGPAEYFIDGKLVYAVPNDGSGKIMNKREMKGHIALLDRGSVPFSQKVKRVQDAGAIAAIIIDDGQCDRNFDCGYPLGSRSDGKGIGWQDMSHYWDEVHIPSVLVLQHHGAALKRTMNLQSINIPGYGEQLYNVI